MFKRVLLTILYFVQVSGYSTKSAIYLDTIDLRDEVQRVLSPQYTCLPKDVAEDNYLLPPNMNPSEAGVLTDENLKLYFEIFDPVDASKRHYDHVDPLDGLTVGIAHWPQSKIEDLFMDINQKPEVKEVFIARATELAANEQLFCKKLGIESCSPQGIRDHIEATMFNKKWLHRYKEVRVNSLYEEHPWFTDLFAYTMRDKRLVEWQVDYYKRDIIEPAAKSASKVGYKSYAGTIMASNMMSSSTNRLRKFEKQIRKKGKIKVGIFESLDWNEKPKGVSSLENWRLYIGWRYTNKEAKGIRNRMGKFYCQFLKEDFPDEKVNCSYYK